MEQQTLSVTGTVKPNINAIASEYDAGIENSGKGIAAGMPFGFMAARPKAPGPLARRAALSARRRRYRVAVNQSPVAQQRDRKDDWQLRSATVRRHRAA